MKRASIPSPLCPYQEPCPQLGRAVLGKPKRIGGAINRTIRCLRCGARGVESRGPRAR